MIQLFYNFIKRGVLYFCSLKKSIELFLPCFVASNTIKSIESLLKFSIFCNVDLIHMLKDIGIFFQPIVCNQDLMNNLIRINF